MDPSGRYVYVTIGSQNKVWKFAMNPLTGALHSGVSFDTGTMPSGLVLSWTAE